MVGIISEDEQLANELHKSNTFILYCRYAANKETQLQGQILAECYWYLQQICLGCSIDG